MRIDFNVLWVEDQQDSVKAIRDSIGAYIRKEGFRLDVKFAGSMDEAMSFIGNDIYGDHIDLILMDYDLGAGQKGDEGLVEVRKQFPFKDIVFYSAQAADLAGMVAKGQIQGIFCSDRGGLADEVKGLFEALVKKVLDIDHSRGIVMGSSSDIDGLVLDCLATHFQKDGDVLSTQARDLISKRLKDIRKDFEKDIKAIEDAKKMAEIAELHRFYTSADRLQLLRKILDAGGKYAEVCEAIKLYAADTMPKRNDLGHVRVKKNGFSRKLYDRRGNELTSETVKALRQKLLDHQELMEKLANQLKTA